MAIIHALVAAISGLFFVLSSGVVFRKKHRRNRGLAVITAVLAIVGGFEAALSAYTFLGDTFSAFIDRMVDHRLAERTRVQHVVPRHQVALGRQHIVPSSVSALPVRVVSAPSNRLAPPPTTLARGDVKAVSNLRPVGVRQALAPARPSSPVQVEANTSLPVQLPPSTDPNADAVRRSAGIAMPLARPSDSEMTIAEHELTSIGDKIFFGRESAEISPSGKTVLMQWAGLLNEHPGLMVNLITQEQIRQGPSQTLTSLTQLATALASPGGDDGSITDISFRRVTAIKKALVDEGVASGRIVITAGSLVLHMANANPEPDLPDGRSVQLKIADSPEKLVRG
ncbi:MAG: hypothetical protein WDM91_08730 [Rhizomicrobium sp.]